MRKYLLPLLLFTSQAQALMVVSDVDDTFKITNSASAVDAAWAGLFKKNVFAGMPELYRSWKAQGAQLYFVTGSPTLIAGRIRSLLASSGVSYDGLRTRGNLSEGNLSFKVRTISALMDAQPDEQVVLLGDDVDKDPEVLSALAQKYPGRVIGSYIRPVRHRASLVEQIPYVTAFDIAAAELQRGRLTEAQVSEVQQEILSAPSKRLFPSFVWCPTDLAGTMLPTETTAAPGAEAVKERVESICRGRQSGSENLPEALAN